MTQRRSGPFRPVSIHRRAAGEQADAETAQRKLTFSDLLKQRRVPVSGRPPRSPAPAPAPSGSTPSELDDQVDHAAPDAEADEPPAAASDPHDEASVQAPAQPLPVPVAQPGHDAGLTAALAPSETALDDLVFGLRAAAHVARVGGDETHPAVLSLARTISQFCNEPAVDDSEGWQVRMPLRADVLPGTTLDLSISSYWLQLRFETTHSSSRELILTHRAALSALLESSLNRRREIAIDVE